MAAAANLFDAANVVTGRLLLRRVGEADLADLMAVNGDPEVTRFLPYDTWRTREDALAWLARTQRAVDAGGAHQGVLVLRDGGTVIGTCLVFRHDAAQGRAELGYVLGRAHAGRGLMREALQALLPRAFELLALRRVEAEADPDNAASHRLLLALGFQCEGLLRQRWLSKGRCHDTRIYGLLRGECRAA